MKLSSKILKYAIIEVVLIVAVFFTALYYLFQLCLMNESANSQKLFAQETLLSIDHLLYGKIISLQEFSKNPYIRNAFGLDAYSTSTLRQEMLDNAGDALKNFQAQSEEWENVVLASADGKIIRSLYNNGNAELSEEEKDALESAARNNTYNSDIILDSGTPNMIFSIAVGTDGAMISRLSWTNFQKYICSKNNYLNCYLFDRNGRLIFTNDSSLSGRLYSAFENFNAFLAQANRKKWIIDRSFLGSQEQLAAISNEPGYIQYKGNNWVLLAARPTSMINKTSMQGLISFAGLALILAFLGFILFKRALDNKFSNPLKILRTGIESIAKTGKTEPLEISGGDEIGQLSLELNAFLRAVKKKDDQLKQEMDAKKINESDFQKFKQAAEYSTDHIFITDDRGVIQYTNPAVLQITGFEPKDVIGKTPAIWGKQMDKAYYEKMWDTIKNKKTLFRDIVLNIRKDGIKFEADLQIIPIVNEGKLSGFVGIQRNVSEFKDIEAAKNDFVSLASHQLCTPLSAINWYSEMLLAGDAGPLNDEQRTYIDQIFHSNKRMVILVNALLNISRIDLGAFSIEPEPIDITQIADEVMKEMPPTFKAKNVVFEKKYDQNLGKISADPNLVRIIFQNILSNSLKYTPEGGKISLLIQKRTKEKDILISVSDTGCGIPKEQQSKIFTKLFRADNVRRMATDGTGLGLYIVKAIMEAAGGKIWFESDPEKGTAFFLTLPLSGMMKKAGTKRLS